ncbi:MAG: amylo-alpha-1,6-glucosidase [bacterium]|nr:amylo-alpha-1,6-glucosidase [bacterium]
MSITKKAHDKAIEVITVCERPQGFHASGLKGGYDATWARDSMITSLGAATVGDKFKKTFAASIALLSKNQSELGQIPNAVGTYNLDRKSEVTFNTIDSNLWYLIGHQVYARAYGSKKLLRKYRKNIDRALLWLRYQDPDELGVLAQQPTMEWFDAFPHKYGYVANTNALYYLVLNLYGRQKEAKNLADIMNGKKAKYVSLWDNKLGYYYPWGWKNHVEIREHEEWFDSLANILAIVTGLAAPANSRSILNFINKNKVDRPYACKTIWPPLQKGDAGWHDYFEISDATEPLHYSNAGIWPFIGGFYVAALVKMGDLKKAEAELENLAKANLQATEIRELKGKYEFNEWLHGATGEPMGEPYQGWSAGAYLYAYECVQKKKVVWF